MAESYPTFLAGNRVTAGLLRSGQEQVARKTSDTSRSATTTTTADPHMQLDVVANAVYRWHGWVKYDGPTAADFLAAGSAAVGVGGELILSSALESNNMSAITDLARQYVAIIKEVQAKKLAPV